MFLILATGLGNHCPDMFALLVHDILFSVADLINKAIPYPDKDRYTAFHLLLQLPMFLPRYSCLCSLQNNLQPFEIHLIDLHCTIKGRSGE